MRANADPVAMSTTTRRLVTAALPCLLLLLLATVSSPAAAQSPSLYISFHGGKSGINNIYSYELNGALRRKGVLSGDSSSELRGMLLLPDWTLLLANAYKADSRISHFGRCNADGMREYLGDFADNGHLAHPYGLAITANDTASSGGGGIDSGSGVVYASNQNSAEIVAYDAGTGAFQRVVAQFGTDELRGVALDARRNVLYVANKDQSAAIAIDLNSNTISSNLSFTGIKKPIGLYIDPASDVLYIGSNAKNSAVYSYSLSTRQPLHVFQDEYLSHPAGMLTIDDSLYVLSQDTLALLRFSTNTGAFTEMLISGLPDTPEQIFLSPC